MLTNRLGSRLIHFRNAPMFSVVLPGSPCYGMACDACRSRFSSTSKALCVISPNLELQLQTARIKLLSAAAGPRGSTEFAFRFHTACKSVVYEGSFHVVSCWVLRLFAAYSSGQYDFSV